MTDTDLFELVRKNYVTANADYLKEQLAIASEYLTEKQREELRQRENAT